MIKNDYGHLHCPYYLEKLSNGVEIYVIPRKNELLTATVLVNKGSYEDVSNQSSPFGTAYYLMNVLYDPKFILEQGLKGIIAECSISYSTTSFTLTTGKGELSSALEETLKRIATPNYSEKEVEEFRKREEERLKEEKSDVLSLVEKYAVKGLYVKSNIQNGIYPTLEEGNLIHASTLKKFQKKYYTSSHIAIFIAGDVNPKEVIEKVKKMPFANGVKEEEQVSINLEDYKKAAEELIEIHHQEGTYLSYGIKFPARKDLYESFGLATFYSYELLLDLLFKKNPYFLSSIADLRSELVSSKLVEAGEDCYVLLSFRTESEKEITNFMANYLTKLTKKISSSFYDRVQKEYYAKEIATLASPYLLVKEFVRSYPNRVPYPSLICHTMRLSYSTLKKLLEQIKTFPRACAICEK